MKGWKALTLGEVMQLEYGKPLASEDRNPFGLYPAYGANGEKDRTDRFYRDQPSIIVGRKGSAGEITLTEEKYWPLDVTYFADFDRERHYLRFLYYLLTRLDLPSLAKGVKPGINRNEVYAIPVMVPPLPEQLRIVAILDEAFEGIAIAKANAEKNLQNARELFASRMQVLFGQEEAWERIQLEELLARGWITSHLDGNHGSDYPRKEEFVEAGVPYIAARAIKGGFVDFDEAKYLSPKRAATIRKGLAKDRDVLFAHNATVGPVAVLSTDEDIVILGTSLTYYRCDSQHIHPEYLAHFMLSPAFTSQYAQVMKQSTRNQVPITKQREFYHVIPPIDVQRRIADHLDELSMQTERLADIDTRKLIALDELKQSLLVEAFSGRL